MNKYFKSVIKKKSVHVSLLYMIGNLFNKAIAFITIPIFTRLMSSSDYGIVNTYLSWTTLLSVVIGLSVSNTIRNAYIDYKDNLNQYISSIFFLSIINFLLSISVILIINHYFINVNTVLVVLCVIQAYMIFIQNTMDVLYMLEMQYIKKTLLLSLPNFLITIISIVVLYNINNNKIMGRIIPYVCVYSIIGIAYLCMYIYKGKVFYSKKYWKYALTISLPLVFHGLSLNILTASDKTMITMLYSSAESGIYSLVYNLSMVANVVTASLEGVWIPWMISRLECGDKNSINRNVKPYIEIVVIVMIGIIFIGPDVLKFMAPKEYWSGNVLIPPLLLASYFIFLYSIYVNLEYYYKSTKSMARNTIITASLNVMLNYILTPKYGAIGAAVATVISYFISFLIHAKTAIKLDNELFPIKIFIKPTLLLLSCILIVYMTMNCTIIRWISLVLILIGYTIYTFRTGRLRLFMNLNK